MDIADAFIYVCLGVSAFSSLFFMYGLSTRTVWWKKFCGVGWFLMALPVGGIALTTYMFLRESEHWYWGEEIGRIFIACSISFVMLGFTAILYRRNNTVEVEIVREEIIKER